MTDKSKRIRKLIAKRPEMTDEQIARKIGMSTGYGKWRVGRERYLMGEGTDGEPRGRRPGLGFE